MPVYQQNFIYKNRWLTHRPCSLPTLVLEKCKEICKWQKADECLPGKKWAPRRRKERLPGDGRRLWGEIHTSTVNSGDSFTGIDIFQTYQNIHLKYVQFIGCPLHLTKPVIKKQKYKTFSCTFKNLQQLTFLDQKQIFLFFHYPM